MKNYIPQGKDDTKYAANLKKLSIEIVVADVPELLIWLQDLHWDAAQGVVEYFKLHVNKIKVELIKILCDNDTEWKLGIMTLIASSTNKPDVELMAALKHIVDHPTKDDQEQELDEIARDIIARYSI